VRRLALSGIGGRSRRARGLFSRRFAECALDGTGGRALQSGLIRFGDPVAAHRSGGVWPAELAFRLEPVLPVMARRTAARL
jgi:hypothetical protein